MRIILASLLVIGCTLSAAPASIAGCGIGAPAECYAAEAREKARERNRLGGAWVTAVEKCQREAKFWDSGFEAFIPGPRLVQALGTAQGRYTFMKCMADAGQPVETR